MMSQNRQEAKDRLRAENDYEINLKAEIEIRKLHERWTSPDASMATSDGFPAATGESDGGNKPAFH